MRKLDIKEAQACMLDILCEIDHLCHKHKIKYWLDGGTLLGAVRHQSFISWDDDIDICMPRDDYNKFISMAEKELGSKYFLQTSETDTNYCIKTIPCKVRLNDSLVDENIHYELGIEDIDFHKGIFIDIFPVDNTSDSLMYQWTYKIFSIFYFLKSISYFTKYTKKKTYILSRFFKYIPLIIFDSFKNALINYINKKEEDKCTYGIECVIYNNVFNKRDIYPLSTIEFCGKKFSAPNNYDGYLITLYGSNYITPPPIEQQHIHCADIFIK